MSSPCARPVRSRNSATRFGERRERQKKPDAVVGLEELLVLVLIDEHDGEDAVSSRRPPESPRLRCSAEPFWKYSIFQKRWMPSTVTEREVVLAVRIVLGREVVECFHRRDRFRDELRSLRYHAVREYPQRFGRVFAEFVVERGDATRSAPSPLSLLHSCSLPTSGMGAGVRAGDAQSASHAEVRCQMQ